MGDRAFPSQMTYRLCVIDSAQEKEEEKINMGEWEEEKKGTEGQGNVGVGEKGEEERIG